MIFANFGLKVDNFLRFHVESNYFCQFWLKSGFKLLISFDFPFKEMIFGYVSIKVDLKQQFT